MLPPGSNQQKQVPLASSQSLTSIITTTQANYCKSLLFDRSMVTGVWNAPLLRNKMTMG